MFTPKAAGSRELTVRQLKEFLDDLISDIGEDEANEMVVRTMSQSGWPFEYVISGHISSDALAANEDHGYPECVECGGVQESRLPPKQYRDEFAYDICRCEEFKKPLPVLYFVEGQQLGYGVKSAWDDQERFGW
jgi:hypothetical protein